MSDIKFFLEGPNLIHDNGKEYKLFLRQALSGFRVQQEEQKIEEESKLLDPQPFPEEELKGHSADQNEDEDMRLAR